MSIDQMALRQPPAGWGLLGQPPAGRILLGRAGRSDGLNEPAGGEIRHDGESVGPGRRPPVPPMPGRQAAALRPYNPDYLGRKRPAPGKILINPTVIK